jgi:hypothetical protein
MINYFIKESMIETSKIQNKLTFSGHDTFHCRHLWLKKGYEFVNAGKKFTDNDAVVFLGVGKNMVSAIRFWMKAFDLINEDDELELIAHKIFADKTGWDPYLEDDATLWILHHNLVKNGYASTYSLVFNQLRKEKIEFSKKNYIDFINRKCQLDGIRLSSANTLDSDFGVFGKMYLRTDSQSKDKEDTFSGILTELDLVVGIKKGTDLWLAIENNDRDDLPEEIILFAILSDDRFDLSVNIRSLEIEDNSIASIFAITRTGLENKMESISNNKKKFKNFTYSNHAGTKELQFTKRIDPIEILNTYYEDQ